MMTALASVSPALIIAMAVACNVCAQVTMKMYSGNFSFSPLPKLTPILMSVGFYGLSFILTAKVLQKVELSTAGPLMAGLTFALVFLAGVLIFNENISQMKIWGVLFIITGVIFITRGTSL